MSRALKDLIETVMIDIDEDLGEIAIKERIKKFMQRAYKELARREEIDKSVEVTAVDGLIDKPDDYVRAIKIIQNDELVTYEEKGNQLSVNANGDMTLVYNYTPIALTDNDYPLTNPANDEFLIEYAKHLYYMSESGSSNQYKAEVHKRNYELFTIKKTKKKYTFKVVR